MIRFNVRYSVLCVGLIACAQNKKNNKNDDAGAINSKIRTLSGNAFVSYIKETDSIMPDYDPARRLNPEVCLKDLFLPAARTNEILDISIDTKQVDWSVGSVEFDLSLSEIFHISLYVPKNETMTRICEYESDESGTRPISSIVLWRPENYVKAYVVKSGNAMVKLLGGAKNADGSRSSVQQGFDLEIKEALLINKNIGNDDTIIIRNIKVLDTALNGKPLD